MHYCLFGEKPQKMKLLFQKVLFVGLVHWRSIGRIINWIEVKFSNKYHYGILLVFGFELLLLAFNLR
jgi:hypothetical protein